MARTSLVELFGGCNESCAHFLVADSENFFELIDEKKPLVAAALESMNELGRSLWFCVGELARLGLTEPGGLDRGAERLERIHVRHEGEISESRPDELRQLRQQPRAHNRRFAAARCAEHQQHIARAQLRKQALDQLIAAEEEILVAIFKAIQPAIG